MVACKNCGLPHPGYMTCREAKARAGLYDLPKSVQDLPEKPRKEPPVFVCPVCEARKLKERQRVQRWRAKK